MNNSIISHIQLIEPLENNKNYNDDVQIVEIANNQDIEKEKAMTQQLNDDVIRIMRNYGQIYPRNFGKYCVFKFKEKEPIFAIGPHWPLFLFSYSLLSFAGFKLIEYSFIYFSGFYPIFSILTTSFLLFTFLTTALKNPGIASAQYEILNENDVQNELRYCKLCQILRPKGTTHCLDCDVCIKEYDHHCLWTGKCIGQGNLEIFYLFIISLMIFMIYSIFLVISKI